MSSVFVLVIPGMSIFAAAPPLDVFGRCNFLVDTRGKGEDISLQRRRQTAAMEEFQVPEDMGDPLALQVQTAGRFCASQDLPSLKDESTERLDDILDSVGTRLAHGEVDALSGQENFDDVYSLVRSVCASCVAVQYLFWCMQKRRWKIGTPTVMGRELRSDYAVLHFLVHTAYIPPF